MHVNSHSIHSLYDLAHYIFMKSDTVFPPGESKGEYADIRWWSWIYVLSCMELILLSTFPSYAPIQPLSKAPSTMNLIPKTCLVAPVSIQRQKGTIHFLLRMMPTKKPGEIDRASIVSSLVEVMQGNRFHINFDWYYPTHAFFYLSLVLVISGRHLVAHTKVRCAKGGFATSRDPKSIAGIQSDGSASFVRYDKCSCQGIFYISHKSIITCKDILA